MSLRDKFKIGGVFQTLACLAYLQRRFATATGSFSHSRPNYSHRHGRMESRRGSIHRRLRKNQAQSFSGYSPLAMSLRMLSTTCGRSSRYVTPNQESGERNTFTLAWPVATSSPTVLGM